MKLKNFAWNIFEETGDPEAYLLYKELSSFEEYAAEEDLLPDLQKAMENTEEKAEE